MQKSISAILMMIAASMLWAADTTKPKDDSGVQPLMRKLMSHLTQLTPFMSSEKEFSAPENDLEIATHLKAMAELAKKAPHEPMLKSANFRFSGEVLQSHIQETERLFRLKNKKYARWMLNSTKSVCLSCHTQMPGYSRSAWNVDEPDTFASTFLQAEFLFTTHDFDSAMPLYDSSIADFPQNKITVVELQTAMERKLAYFARIKRNPKAGIESLGRDLKNKKIPESLAKNVRAWIASFQEWKKEPSFNPSTASSDQMLKYAKKNLKESQWDKFINASDPGIVSYLKVSGMLYEFLATHPETAVTPEILLLLARCDRSLNNNFFYSLANMYLKECIVKYPKTPTAKDCFKEFEEETIVSYSGSAGTFLPADVKLELKRLKALISGSSRGK